ncbi:flagellar basal body rod protein FlgC [Dyella acidiphila]|uniref:Flagellar basal body rod protein N-terminal domain-containing protein n=1 Tax=Dyella acidiphila TaxID=2775866 RepID=A0ABR9G977_9GAMM|nr:flagellar basal body protein [Dyella acidiphila]MBE1160601.1 hypothetical protein [Dyella acidiphila]
MSFKSIAQIASSAMSAQTVRLNTVASNLANANTTGTEQSAYRARKPVFASVFDGAGARVQVLDVISSDEPLNARYEPDHPITTRSRRLAEGQRHLPLRHGIPRK